MPRSKFDSETDVSTDQRRIYLSEYHRWEKHSGWQNFNVVVAGGKKITFGTFGMELK